MCIFCAAIPVAMAAGAKARQVQFDKIRLAEEEGRPPFRRIVPAGRATLVVIAGLVAASVVVHTQFGGVL